MQGRAPDGDGKAIVQDREADAGMRRLVIIESPYAGDVERNLKYARACAADCIKRGESPYASHLLYTQPGILDDNVPAEREAGINCGYAWWKVADLICFYTDLGWSKGMARALTRALDEGKDHEARTLSGWSET